MRTRIHSRNAVANMQALTAKAPSITKRIRVYPFTAVSFKDRNQDAKGVPR